jgi:preprotein translocase subunit SecF
MKILKYKRVYLTISAMLVLFAIASISFFGFNLSIDFKGGTVYEITYPENAPSISQVKEVAIKSGLPTATVQKLDQNDFVIKAAEISDENLTKLKNNLSFNSEYSFEEKRVKNIGPSVSGELATKSLFAILFVSLAIVLFIAYVFRGVSKPVSSFKFGLVAVIALIHDIIIPTGIFAALGSVFVNYQIDVLFVTALLAILGFSVNDTIVVFDRVRENLKNSKEKKIRGEKFEKIVGKSLEETIVRSLNTSITTFIVLLVLFIVGGEVIKPFALVLMLGTLFGTYSSIFIASPLLVYIEKFQKEVPEDKEKKKKKKEAEAKEFSEKEIAEALERLRAKD